MSRMLPVRYVWWLNEWIDPAAVTSPQAADAASDTGAPSSEDTDQ